MRKYRKYTDEDIIRFAKEVKSIAGLLDKLDLIKAGGNYINLKKNLQRLKVDTSHWTGQGWNKAAKLKDWSKYTLSASLKPHLIKERGHQCQNCKSNKWMDEIIPLELHHIDGDRTNNNQKNLQLLCPNCHALTDNYCQQTWIGAVEGS